MTHWKRQRFRHSPGLSHRDLDSGGTKLLLRELHMALFAFVLVLAFFRMRPGIFAFVAVPAVVVFTR